MKKVLLFAALAVVGFTTQAQVKYGVKAGVNFANAGGSDASDAFPGKAMLVSFHAGGLVNIPVAKQLSVQPELLFSGEGVKLDGGKYLLNYINIPIMVQYDIASGVYAETGPQVGLLMSAKAKPDGGSSVDVKDYFKSTAFSWAIGAGYKLESGLGFNARYALGLSKLPDEGDAKINSNVISVSVSYVFGGHAKKK